MPFLVVRPWAWTAVWLAQEAIRSQVKRRSFWDAPAQRHVPYKSDTTICGRPPGPVTDAHTASRMRSGPYPTPVGTMTDVLRSGGRSNSIGVSAMQVLSSAAVVFACLFSFLLGIAFPRNLNITHAIDAGSQRLASTAGSFLPVAQRCPNDDSSAAFSVRPDWRGVNFDDGYCERLLADLRPGLRYCVMDENSVGCADGVPRAFSQFRQDYVLYKNHFSKLTGRRGTYADIAANEAVRISNTAFFDRCLNWRGVCVEANPSYHEELWRMRSCDLVPTCVGTTDGEVVNFTLAEGIGGITATNKNPVQGRPEIVLRCTTAAKALARSALTHIDYLSLDVEGHELPVLQGIEWNNTRINVITVELSEATGGPIKELLAGQGFRIQDLRGQDDEHIDADDTVFVHSSVVWGSPV